MVGTMYNQRLMTDALSKRQIGYVAALSTVDRVWDVARELSRQSRK